MGGPIYSVFNATQGRVSHKNMYWCAQDTVSIESELTLVPWMGWVFYNIVHSDYYFEMYKYIIYPYSEFNYKDIAVWNAKNISLEHYEKSIDKFMGNPIKIIIIL